MRKRRNTYVAVLLSTFMISQLSGINASTASGAPINHSLAIAAAATTPTANTTNPNLGTVQLGSNIKAVLEEVNLWPQTGGNILSYTLNYSNGSNSSANLAHYFSRVVTPGGSVIPGNPVTADALKKKVASKGNQRVTYYVNIGKVNSLQGIKIPMYVWNAKAKGYLKQTGTFNLPAGYSAAAAVGKNLNTTMNDIPVASGAESLQLYKFNGKVYAKVGINLTNKGNKVLGDPGYAAYLVSAGGASFELALDSSQSGYKIQPQEKKLIYYLTEIPSYLKTNNMKLQLVQKDETLKLELPKISYKLPAATSPDLTVGKGVVKKIIINNNTVETLLGNAVVYAENEKGMWSFQLRLKNKGNKAVTMPSYELAVKSSKGTTFPVNSKGLNGLTLKPMEEKVIPLTAQVPLEVEQNTLQLQMVEAINTDTAGAAGAGAISETGGTTGNNGNTATTGTAMLNFPIAYFIIPYTLVADTLKETEYTATSPYGTFTYNLQSIQRFPWKDDDIVVAKLKITNTQSVSLSLPDLKGAVKLDSEDLASATELFIDNDSKSLAPGSTAEIYVLAKIPYTLNFNKTNIVLYSTANEETVPFLTLSTSSLMNNVRTIGSGDTYAITGKGKNAKVQENRTVVYEGLNSNIVYTELLMSSEEKRQSKMARLQAYYRTGDGQLFEATANQPDTLATPGSKQLVTFWAKIPKNVSASYVTLYMGPGITGSKLTEPGQEPTGFINIASLELDPKPITPETTLGKVALYPYTLSVQSSEGRYTQGSNSISIQMNYSLQRESSYDMGNFDHKLTLKMTDPYGLSQERTLTLGTDIIIGENNTYSVSFSSSKYEHLAGGAYRLTLYDEFQGERIELASQAYKLTYVRTPSTDK